MIDDNPTERVEVLRSDLETWQQIMRWTHGHFQALDLSDNYREGRPEMKISRITRLTAKAHNRIEGYLSDEGSQDDRQLLPAE